ncbi:MAG: hydroxymethylglutaryl-CoA lyase [Solibacillus sp.]
MTTPQKIEICEVAPRDGFQAEHEWIPTEVKLEIIRQLATTGVTSMEITSFVHPKAIPQLRDAEEVAVKAQDLIGIKMRALVPNERGAQRAIDAGIKKLKLMLSATDSHSLSNANATSAEAQKKLEPIIELAAKQNVSVGGSLSVAFGCPYEGIVRVETLIPLLERYNEMGIYEVSLADTSGMANPLQVKTYLQALKQLFPTTTFSMHLHNTRGMAFANAVAAWEEGIIHFDSSVAGLGGCPYAPGATGNIATEDLIHGFEEMGVKTGIDLLKMIEVAKSVQQLLHKTDNKASYMLQAGPNSQLSDKPTRQQKLI